MTGKSEGRQHWMVVCRITGCEEEERHKDGTDDHIVEAEKKKSAVRNSKRASDQLGGYKELPDDWMTIATVIREIDREVFGVSSGQSTGMEMYYQVRRAC